MTAAISEEDEIREEEEKVPSSVSLQRTKHQYLVNFEGVEYDVFLHLDYDGEEEPITKIITIYLVEDEEEIVDMELEKSILELLGQSSN